MAFGYIFLLSVVVLILGVPLYRLEIIRYKDIYQGCYDNWEKDKELSNLNICSDPEFRERFKNRVNCEGASKSSFTSPKECAFVGWWLTFTPIVLYRDISRSWYMYILVTILLIVFVLTWVSSNAKVKIRKEELRTQSRIFRKFSNQMLSNGNWMPQTHPNRALPPPPPPHKQYRNKYPDRDHDQIFVMRGKGGTVRIEEIE